MRIPVLYGEVERLEESAVTIMFDKVQFSNKSANMDHWQQRFPTHVKDVATVCRQLAEKRMLVRTKVLFSKFTRTPSKSSWIVAVFVNNKNFMLLYLILFLKYYRLHLSFSYCKITENCIFLCLMSCKKPVLSNVYLRSR